MTASATASLAAAAEPLPEAPWSLEPGAAIVPYEVRSRFEKSVVRTLSNPNFRPPNREGFIIRFPDLIQ